MSPPATVLQEIKSHIQKRGRGYTAWYAGVASDARSRLFTDHRVDETHGEWIFRTLNSDAEARIVEEALLSLGCKGASGGGDASSNKVYAYLITATTVE